MKRNCSCIVPGSYDPVTFGHLDIISRAAVLFGSVCAAVLVNTQKTGMFSPDERLKMLQEAVGGIPGVFAVRYDGLLTDLLKQQGARVIVRGVRTASDFETERQLASVNASILSGTETVLLPASADNSAVSSSIVRELISFGADISAFAPPSVVHAAAAVQRLPAQNEHC